MMMEHCWLQHQQKYKNKKGTTIRVFSTSSSKFIQELRRGISAVKVIQIVFHPSSRFLACTSEKSSIHIYELSETVKYFESNKLELVKKEYKYY